jgi:arylsulfatase A-like enzyme
MMDLLPTLAEFAGAALPNDRIIDGKNMAPILENRPGAKSLYEAFYCYQRDQLQAVRSGPWKLYVPLENKLINLAGKTAPSAARLVDVLADPGETTNLAAQKPEVVRRLTAFAENARRDLGDVGRPSSGQRPAGRVADPRPLRRAVD